MYPTLVPEVILRYIIKALNNTMGPKVLVPSILVFGTIPTFPSREINHCGQDERMDFIRTAMEEMERIATELRINTSLKSKLPPATRYYFSPVQNGRVYRGNSRRWEGPSKVAKVHGKLVLITDVATNKNYSCTQLLPDPSDVADREMSRLWEGFNTFGTGCIP